MVWPRCNDRPRKNSWRCTRLRPWDSSEYQYRHVANIFEFFFHFFSTDRYPRLSSTNINGGICRKWVPANLFKFNFQMRQKRHWTDTWNYKVITIEKWRNTSNFGQSVLQKNPLNTWRAVRRRIPSTLRICVEAWLSVLWKIAARNISKPTK